MLVGMWVSGSLAAAAAIKMQHNTPTGITTLAGQQYPLRVPSECSMHGREHCLLLNDNYPRESAAAAVRSLSDRSPRTHRSCAGEHKRTRVADCSRRTPRVHTGADRQAADRAWRHLDPCSECQGRRDVRP